MSRFFEALQRTEDTVADLVLPVAASKGASAEKQPEAPAAPPPPSGRPGERPLDAQQVAAAALSAASGQPMAAAMPPSVYATVKLDPPKNAPLLPLDSAETRAAEQYRIIRTKVIQDPRQPRVLIVSSPELGDGKSITACNIALSLALKPDTSVLLLDGDFRRSSVNETLGIRPPAGLAEVLSGTCTPEQAIVCIESLPSLHVLGITRKPRNPAELLDSPRWRALFDDLRHEFDFVVIDAPPVELVADYDLIGAVADGVILVIRPDHTHRVLCRQAMEAVGEDRLVGVVMNCVPTWFLWKTLGSHDYRYYTRHYRGADSESPAGGLPPTEAASQEPTPPPA